ncbi:hypothetical protein KAU33_13120, partial [Candidatus Dependentiae bacterium]|nr:hypothetical protein [Candidatus Dependentiae bacterium]
YFDEIHLLVVRDHEEASEMFRNGEIDIYIPQTSELEEFLEEEYYKDNIISTPSLDIKYLGFNTQSETPFRNKEIRQACNYAINVPELISNLLGRQAIPAKGVLPPGVKGYNKMLNVYKYNPERALDLLAANRFPGGLPDVYPLVCSNRDVEVKKAELVSGYLAQIGIKVDIIPLPWKGLIDRCNKGDTVLFLMGWISDNGDPDNFFFPLFHSDNLGVHGNYTYFNVPNIDEMIETAMQIKNPGKRIDYYKQVEKAILEEAPAVFLHHQVDYMVTSPELRNVHMHPLGLKRWGQMWKK